MGDSTPYFKPEVDEEIMISQIEELKTWVSNQPTIPTLSNKTLELFLHSCIYDVCATKQTLLAYFKLRIESSYFFSDRNPFSDDLKSAGKSSYCFLLPGFTDEGYRVFMSGYLPWSEHYGCKRTLKKFMMQIDMWLSKVDKCAGFYLVIDSQNSCLSHLTSVSFDAIKKLTIYVQEALPVRLKGIFFVNISTVTNMMITMAQPILSKKICDLIHKHTTEDKGYRNYLPKRMLPSNFDGELGTIDELNEAAMKELEDYAEWFQEQDKIIMSLVEKNTPPPSKTKTRSWLFR